MTSANTTTSWLTRYHIYALLIVVTCAGVVGRIMTVESSRGKTPFLSANDRSRWAAIRAIVDEQTFVLDKVIFRPSGKRDSDWHSIDLVRHRGHDNKEHYYSSKPTLPTILLAGEYWLIQRTLGVYIEDEPFFVGRLMLVLTNVIPLAIYLYVLMRLIERYGRSDWGRLLVFVVGAFGTFITTFSVTLNNHTLAATTALLAVHAVLHIRREAQSGWQWYAWAGLCAGLTSMNELPALAFVGLVGIAIFLRSPLKTVAAYVPVIALIGAAALGTNYYAHGSWKTPYAHRKDGSVRLEVKPKTYSDDVAQLNAGQLPGSLMEAMESNKISVPSLTEITTKTPDKRWMLWMQQNDQRYAIVATADHLQLREWDNWYDYEGTYWNDKNKMGVDKGEPSRFVYAFHCLLGHHGIFSLTPIWLLSMWGLWLLWRRDENELRWLAAIVAGLMLLVLAFYIVQRPLEDRNYGGVSAGLRWMFWFIPFWLVALLPAVDAISHKRRYQAVAYLLLAVSVFSAHYASLNPWTPPWLFDYWTYLGWIAY